MVDKSSIRQKAKEIIKKRIKGKAIPSDFREEEIPVHIIELCDSSKELAIISTFLWIITSLHNISFFPFFLSFAVGFIFLKVLRKTHSAQEKLQRLHQIIEDERWQIEHKRKEEKNELEILYKAKGFSGQLLEDVVQTLMLDDNRLLQIMIEEEMGIALGSFEHPLKQGFGAFIGTFVSAILIAIGTFFSFGVYIAAVLIIIISSIISARYKYTNVSTCIIWNLSIATVVCLVTYFFAQLIQS